MRYFIAIYALLVVITLSILGFRGSTTTNTPIEVFPDMDRQAKFKAQTRNPMFSDDSSDRLPVVGTASRGNAYNLENVFSVKPDLKSIAFKSGKTSSGDWVDNASEVIEVDMSLLRLGKEKYDIHCSICHGVYGNGLGVLSKFGLAPRNLSDPSQKGTYLESSGKWSDGQLYHAISAGSASGIMLGLSDKLTPKERWAVVLYVRTLQDFVGEATNSTKKIGS
jgi:mono/diheme cytochrome c family protein